VVIINKEKKKIIMTKYFIFLIINNMILKDLGLRKRKMKRKIEFLD